MTLSNLYKCINLNQHRYVLSALIDFDTYSIDRLLNVYSYLPFLYSCVSFLGVLMLLICTPLGFARYV